MTIESEITKLNTNLTNSYTACQNKGATMPTNQNFDNLATCVSSIPTATEPTLASLTVTPSTTAQTLTPPSGTDGYNTVIASAVTASIDSDIVAGNIKSGVNILGVNGSLTELKGETRTVSITSSSGNTFTPSSGKNGITSIKCNPTNKALTITPSKTSQTKTVPSGYSGYGTVKCNAVTSSIDSNITAGNIKSGVTILGVTGTYEGSGGGGGGSSNFDLPSNMKIIKATSMRVVYNNTDIDIENLLTDGGEALPYLTFCCDMGDELNASASDYYLTGGFFLSFYNQYFASNENYCIGMNEGYKRSTWNGIVFGVWQAGNITLEDGIGTITYMVDGSGVIELSVTWDIPE